jgi:D-alanine-D-alanine ligase
VTLRRAVVLREEIAEPAALDDQDTIRQAECVRESLSRAGWDASLVVLGSDARTLEQDLEDLRPEVVFNLVESWCGLASLACVVPALCRKRGVPCTGSDEGALALAGDKALARRFMQAAAIPAPEGVSLEEIRLGDFPGAGRYIVKSRFEDASLGLGPDCVVEAGGRDELLRIMETLAPRMAGDCVAERYVAGQEFNLALLAGPDGGVQALPLAEMVFDSGLSGPAILHYAAKWEEGSTAFAASARRFVSDHPLGGEMVAIGLRCWEVFGLAGYARIDFRMSGTGDIFVIDVNPNPCITPDAGFAAAACQAGLHHVEIVRRIAAAALRRAGRLGASRG